MKETDTNAQIVKDRMGNERVVSHRCFTSFQITAVTSANEHLNLSNTWLTLLLVTNHIAQFKSKQLTLVHTRTLKMTDDVLSVRYSPDGRLLAVALLDSTVKVFYQDSLKFFLSLYGHKVSIFSKPVSTQVLQVCVPQDVCLIICRFHLFIYFHTINTAPCPFDGHLIRFQASRHLLGRQEHQDLGS